MSSGDPRPPDLFDRAWAGFTRALDGPIAEAPRSIGITAAVLVLFAALLATSPALFADDMPLDLFVPLDGAWRMEHEQWPHLDFYTPIGALYYVLLDWAGPSALAPVYANLIVWPFAMLAAWVLTRNRLPVPLRVALFAWLGLMALSPRTLDAPLLISHLASYNRHGWLFTSLVLTGVLLQPTDRSSREAVLEVALMTACVVACFYLKVTFFALSGAFLIAAVLFGGANRTTALATGIASLGIVGIGFALGETNAAYLADLSRAGVAGSDGASLIRTDRFGAIFTGNQAQIVVLFALWVGLIRTSRTEEEEGSASFEVMRMAAMLGLAFVVTSQSHDKAMPVLAVLLLGAARVWHDRWLKTGDRALGMRVAAAAAVAFLAMTITLDALCIVKHAIQSRSSSTVAFVEWDGAVQRLRIPDAGDDVESPLARVIEGSLPHDAYDNLNPPWAHDDPIITRDALDLLGEHGLTDKRIASLTFSPMFPWILGAPPPAHMPAWHDFRRTFSAEAAGDLDRALSDAEVVLVPKVWRIEGIWEVYGPAVEERFELRDETALWKLWVRGSAAQKDPGNSARNR